MPVAHPAVEALRRARQRLYAAKPQEVAALEARRQVMQPAGPLLYAEAETRLLHEQLSLVALSAEAGDLDLASEGTLALLRLLLERAATRLGGWYSLREAETLLRQVLETVPTVDVAIRRELLREYTFYVGRLNYWLDLAIPWNDINELMRAAGDVDGA